MHNSELGRREPRDHDRALRWRFAASAPGNAPSGDALTLRVVRALAVAVACGCAFFVLGLT